MFGGLYACCWTLFMSPVIEICNALDMRTLNLVMMVTIAFKHVITGIISGVIAWIGILIGGVLLTK